MHHEGDITLHICFLYVLFFICYDKQIGVDDAVVTTTTTTSEWIIEKTSITIKNNCINNTLNKLDNCDDINNNIPLSIEFFTIIV